MLRVTKTEDIPPECYIPPEGRIELWYKIYNDKLEEFQQLVCDYYGRDEVTEEEIDYLLQFEEDYINRELELEEE